MKNDSDIEFEKECTISYLLNNLATGSNYTAETNFYNTQYSELPTGKLKLLRRDTQFFNINLKELIWNNQTTTILPSGQYSLNVQLFIRDPYSQMNIINSNELNLDLK